MYIKLEDVSIVGLHHIQVNFGLYEDDGTFTKKLQTSEKILEIIKKLEIPYNTQTTLNFQKPNTCTVCGGENITHRYHNNEYICYKCETMYNER